MKLSSQPTSHILQALERLPNDAQADHLAAASFTDILYAEGRLELDALAVAVKGTRLLGGLITPDEARALYAASTPARYRRRESTLLDTQVRDTGKIGADALGLRWAGGVSPSLQIEVAHFRSGPAGRGRDVMHDGAAAVAAVADVAARAARALLR